MNTLLFSHSGRSFKNIIGNGIERFPVEGYSNGLSSLLLHNSQFLCSPIDISQFQISDIHTTEARIECQQDNRPVTHRRTVERCVAFNAALISS